MDSQQCDIEFIQSVVLLVSFLLLIIFKLGFHIIMTNVIIACVQREAGRVLSRLYIFQVGCVFGFFVGVFYFFFHFFVLLMFLN